MDDPLWEYVLQQTHNQSNTYTVFIKTTHTRPSFRSFFGIIL